MFDHDSIPARKWASNLPVSHRVGHSVQAVDACYFGTHRPGVTADHDVVRPVHAGDLDAFQQDKGDSCSSPRLFKLAARCEVRSTGTNPPPRSWVRMKMSAAKGR